MTLNELIAALKRCPSNYPVEFDIGGSVGLVNSYRGYYEDLAIACDSKPMTVKDVIHVLSDCIGQNFEGYKGGWYYCDGSEDVYVAEWGDWSQITITGVITENDRVIILTGKED